MRDIYTAASETVAWLGQPSAPDRLWHYLHLYENDLSWRDHVDEILEVLSAPWFGRVWVIQEVACSENIRVLFGGISMSWDYFCDLNFYLNESGVMDKSSATPSSTTGCKSSIKPGQHQRTLCAFS